MDTIVVTGATGQIGSELVHLLASHGSQPEVRAATRNPSSSAAGLLRAMNPQRVHPTAFDIEDEGGLERLFQDATKLCIIAPVIDSMAAWHAKLMEVFTRVGQPEYIVKVSVTGARSPDSDPPPGRFPSLHWQGEEAVRRSGVASTVVRPTIFMQHFLSVPGLYTKGDDRFYLPSSEGEIAFLDCRDIAHAAAKLLTMEAEERSTFEGDAFELTGLSALTASEIAETLSLVAGKPITHVDGVAAFEAHCRELGVTDTLKSVYAEAAEGWFSGLELTTFERITGRQPTSFAKFAYDHAGYFKE